MTGDPPTSESLRSAHRDALIREQMLREASEATGVFIDTAEGITLVVEDGFARGATSLELAMRDGIRELRDYIRAGEGYGKIRYTEALNLADGLIGEDRNE